MKTQIRHNLLNKRDSLTLDITGPAGQAAASFLLDSEFINISQGNAVMIYASFRNEMDTWNIIDALFSKGTKIILPKTFHSDLIPFEYGGPDTLLEDSFGILAPDPAQCKEAVLSEISLVIVPGVGFDKQGNRIGFGRGYYDRFLPKIPNATKIGLCYEFQIQQYIPVCEMDIPMDFLLTEKGFIRCKK